jgi:hypothetical protein
MKLLKLTFLFVCLVAIQIATAQWFEVPPPVQARGLMVAGKGVPVVADGPNTWYDVDSTGTNEKYGSASYADFDIVTVAQAGTATKARVYISSHNAPTIVKMALYSSDGSTLLASGSNTTASTGYLEITFGTPCAVTATTYRLAVQFPDGVEGYYATNSAGAGYQAIVAYASFPAATISAAWAFEAHPRVGIYVD